MNDTNGAAAANATTAIAGDLVTCPHCNGRRRYVPHYWQYKTMPCVRCKASGQITRESLEQSQAFEAWRVSLPIEERSLLAIAHRFGVTQIAIIDWIVGRTDIPEEVIRAIQESNTRADQAPHGA